MKKVKLVAVIELKCLRRFWKLQLLGRIFTTLVVFNIVFSACLCSPKIETKVWTRQLGTTLDDEAEGVVVDNSGNIYVTGETRGGLDGNTNVGSDDIFLIKFDSSGNKLWTRQLGTTFEDNSTGVAIDRSSNNIYVTGFTRGGLDGNTNVGGSDIFLIKFDSSGKKLWTKQLGTTFDDVSMGLSIDSSGNIYVTGRTRGGLDGNTNVGSDDMFLIKFDSSGNKLWTRQLGTTFEDNSSGVAIDSSGNIYVTGETRGGLDGNTNVGDNDIFLIKFDSSGNKLWTRQLGTTFEDYSRGVAIDKSGNIYVTGFTRGELDGNTNVGYSDIFLIKFDSSGNKLWTRQLGTISEDYSFALAVDRSGNIYVTGNTLGGLDGNTNVGSDDIFLIKFDSLGNKLWTRQLGTIYTDNGFGVATDRSDNIYVTGSTYGNFDGNRNVGRSDILLVKFTRAPGSGVKPLK